MKITKSQKGITLVALIITIVVLLILAVVAINSIGSTNIVNYANNAANAFNKGSKDESDQIKNYEDTLNNLSSGNTTQGGGTTGETETVTLTITRYGGPTDTFTLPKGTDLRTSSELAAKGYEFTFDYTGIKWYPEDYQQSGMCYYAMGYNWVITSNMTITMYEVYS